MKLVFACALASALALGAVRASAQDKKKDDVPAEKGAVVVLELAVAGMTNPEKDPPAVKAALEGKGITSVEVDPSTKTAKVTFAQGKARPAAILSKLQKAASKRYGKSKITAMRLELDAEWGRVTAEGSAGIGPDEQVNGVLTITIERKGKHALWGKGNGNASPELDVRPAVGFTAKRVAGDEKGEQRSRQYTYELVGGSLPKSELGVDVEIRLKDALEKDVTPRLVKLVVPIKVN